MIILGYIKEKFLKLKIFKITLGLFIVFNALKLLGNILEGSISGLLEHQRERSERLNKNQIGKSIMDPAKCSKNISKIV